MIRRYKFTYRSVLLSVVSLLTIGCGSDDTPAATATKPELIAHAERRLLDGDFPAATSSFRRALQSDSTSTVALLGLARIYDQMQRTDVAERYRQRAFHLNFELGKVARDANDLTAARDAFALATIASPEIGPRFWASRAFSMSSALARGDVASRMDAVSTNTAERRALVDRMPNPCDAGDRSDRP